MSAQARPVREIEHVLIPLADGTRLAARLWLPADAEAEPVPAVLEYLPYRKRDGTTLRDESTYPVFAAAGYAGVRVDIRGCGESDGVIDDEYSPRELADAVEVIDWIAAQPWCSGSVGMMGISWGGFNALQVAALRPKPLKAVISLASTVDRYNDDIHFKNGCHLGANLAWAATMLCYSSRPPDPALCGDDWRNMWLRRLAGEPFHLEDWLAHQRRDAYWRHGSICEDFSAVEAAALVIAGWADGYRNTPMKAVAGLAAPAKAIVGPWVHKYPHFAWPKPRMDFHGEAIRWWDRWLKGIDNGAERLPALRAYVLDGIRPAPVRPHDRGRWVAEPEWPSPSVADWRLHPTAERGLAERPGAAARLSIRSPQDCGTAAGEYFALKPEAELAGDQRLDDAGSLVFETAPLAAPMEILGMPRLTLEVAIDAPVGNLIARLIDVHPDGAAYRVSLGVLNLAHRAGSAEPRPMTPGRGERVEIVLDACGYRFRPGHRVRLSLSTAYWPFVLPPPTAVTATVATEGAALVLPLRRGGGDEIEVPEPADPDPLPKYRELGPPATSRRVERDLGAGITRYFVFEDSGAYQHPATRLITRQVRDEVWSIDPEDPLSMTAVCRWTAELARGDWSVRTESVAELSCSETEWQLQASVTAFEGGREIHVKRWSRQIPRDFT